MWILILLLKDYIFSFLYQCSRRNFFLNLCSIILRRVSFFTLNFKYLGKNVTKFEIFKPIGQWPRLVRMMKKTRGRKSHWTVPLGNFKLWDSFLHWSCVFFLRRLFTREKNDESESLNSIFSRSLFHFTWLRFVNIERLFPISGVGYGSWF